MNIDITTLDAEKFAYAWANQLGTLIYEPLHCVGKAVSNSYEQ